MCGLAGIYSRFLNEGDYNHFHNLMLLNYFRGKDSTGVFSIGEDHTFDWWKQTVSSPEALYSKEYEDWKPNASAQLAFCGHTRSKTVGETSIDNAHPFEVNEDFIGMHNGTIHYPFSIKNKFGTDSEYLLHQIEKNGIEAALQEACDSNNNYYVANSRPYGYHSYIGYEPSAAYALVYYDLKAKTLNFIRNKERPLYFTVLYNNTLVWTSDVNTLLFFESKITPNFDVPKHIHSLKGVEGYYDTNNKNRYRYFTLKPNVLLTLDTSKFFDGSFSTVKVNIKEPVKTYDSHYFFGA